MKQNIWLVEIRIYVKLDKIYLLTERLVSLHPQDIKHYIRSNSSNKIQVVGYYNFQINICKSGGLQTETSIMIYVGRNRGKIWCSCINMYVLIVNKIDFLYDISSIRRRGGGDPLPAKKNDFFQTKCRKYSACPENLLNFSVLSTLVQLLMKKI